MRGTFNTLGACAYTIWYKPGTRAIADSILKLRWLFFALFLSLHFLTVACYKFFMSFECIEKHTDGVHQSFPTCLQQRTFVLTWQNKNPRTITFFPFTLPFTLMFMVSNYAVGLRESWLYVRSIDSSSMIGAGYWFLGGSFEADYFLFSIPERIQKRT